MSDKNLQAEARPLLSEPTSEKGLRVHISGRSETQPKIHIPSENESISQLHPNGVNIIEM